MRSTWRLSSGRIFWGYGSSGHFEVWGGGAKRGGTAHFCGHRSSRSGAAAAALGVPIGRADHFDRSGGLFLQPLSRRPRPAWVAPIIPALLIGAEMGAQSAMQRYDALGNQRHSATTRLTAPPRCAARRFRRPPRCGVGARRLAACRGSGSEALVVRLPALDRGQRDAAAGVEPEADALRRNRLDAGLPGLDVFAAAGAGARLPASAAEHAGAVDPGQQAGLGAGSGALFSIHRSRRVVNPNWGGNHAGAPGAGSPSVRDGPLSRSARAPAAAARTRRRAPPARTRTAAAAARAAVPRTGAPPAAAAVPARRAPGSGARRSGPHRSGSGCPGAGTPA